MADGNTPDMHKLVNGLRRIRVSMDDAAVEASQYGSGGAALLAQSLKMAIDELLSGADLVGPKAAPMTPGQQQAFDAHLHGTGRKPGVSTTLAAAKHLAETTFADARSAHQQRLD